MNLIELRPCSYCKGRITGTGGSPVFLKITIETHVLDVRNVEKSLALGRFLGSITLANVLNPNPEATTKMGTEEIHLCQDCLGVTVGELTECAIQARKTAPIGG